jgi:hypothetical protein
MDYPVPLISRARPRTRVRSEARPDLGHPRAYRGGKPVLQACIRLCGRHAIGPVQLAAQCPFERQPITFLDLGRFIQRSQQRACQSIRHGPSPLLDLARPPGLMPGARRRNPKPLVELDAGPRQNPTGGRIHKPAAEFAYALPTQYERLWRRFDSLQRRQEVCLRVWARPIPVRSGRNATAAVMEEDRQCGEASDKGRKRF